ncbi:hydrolase [Paractinoplanes abujensis]|uniref:Nicotinamidase-related amidase n=1 Tax=Paractinoplanes abujensis TaxID=882441 RepID=A0A7W7D038_9ACTN|nr:cysteine hydrolase family protein [Actinoplanes abujensis]MBB4697874.1 nicotinamidase-related amidase [Actinoplanes abujensis]GID19642.1 hydrolase [Actinoplanes abujensis]
MTTALLVIDVQESFRQRPLWSTLDNPALIANVSRLVEAARAAGDLVVWVLHAEPGTGNLFDPASGHVRVVDELKPAPDEHVVVKTSHNAFSTTNLQQYLTSYGVTSVTTCGLRTEQCVETTTRVASDFGYEVTFVTDATGTFPIPHWTAPAEQTVAELLADPRTLAAADVVSRTEYALAGRFAAVRTVDDYLGE